MPGQCIIVAVGENGDEKALDRLGIDFWDAADQAEQVFREEGIRPSRDEEIVYAAVCDKKVVGGATVAFRNGGDYPEATFSVAVRRDWQKRNLGRALVSAVESYIRGTLEGGHVELRVWVVNPNMAKLLESMGYDTEGGEWSEDSPHMTKSL